jgi:hypothetical protein
MQMLQTWLNTSQGFISSGLRGKDEYISYSIFGAPVFLTLQQNTSQCPCTFVNASYYVLNAGGFVRFGPRMHQNWD